MPIDHGVRDDWRDRRGLEPAQQKVGIGSHVGC